MLFYLRVYLVHRLQIYTMSGRLFLQCSQIYIIRHQTNVVQIYQITSG